MQATTVEKSMTLSTSSRWSIGEIGTEYRRYTCRNIKFAKPKVRILIVGQRPWIKRRRRGSHSESRAPVPKDVARFAPNQASP